MKYLLVLFEVIVILSLGCGLKINRKANKKTGISHQEKVEALSSIESLKKFVGIQENSLIADSL